MTQPAGDVDGPDAAHPAEGVPVALEPDDLSARPLTVDQLGPLLPKIIA